MASHEHTRTPTAVTRRSFALAGTALALTATAVPPAVAAPRPDAQLLRLCAERLAVFSAEDAAYDVFGNMSPADPGHGTWYAEFMRAVAAGHDLMPRIAALPARTAAGRAAKAAVLLRTCPADVAEDPTLYYDWDAGLILSLCRDVVAAGAGA